MNCSMTMTPSQHFMINGLPLEPVSRTYQYRKIMKPMLERKRRARINKCLEELKDLMTGTFQADGENVSKLEKADILELTVRHLQRLRESNSLFIRRNETINMDKFWAGFQHCAAEVSQFLNKYDQHISGDLIKYIANYIPNIAAQAAVAAANVAQVKTPPVSSNFVAQQRLNATHQMPLSLSKPCPVKFEPNTFQIECNQMALRRQNRMHPYARNLNDMGSDSDGESGGVWRPW